MLTDTFRSPGPGSRKYVTIKINVNTLSEDFLKGRREIATKLRTTNPNHPGYKHVRFMLDTFSIKTKHGTHLCIVYDVLREPLDECQLKFSSGVYASAQIRKLLPALLKGLDYMHSECHVVHTDLKADNIMMGLGDDPNAVLDKFVAYQQTHPSPRKAPDNRDGHIIYKSSSDLLLVGEDEKGLSITEAMLASAKITDIGLAEFGDIPQTKAIQSNAFTCPEVLLGAGWSYPADIWNFGAMLWDLIENDGLFDHIQTAPGKYHANEHLALMICLLGPPPKQLLEKGLKTSNFFDYDTEKQEYVFKWPKFIDRYKDLMTFDHVVTHMQGETKKSFIDFAKKMLAWLPEDRWTAAQLLEHPWLNTIKGSVTCACQNYEEASRTISRATSNDTDLDKRVSQSSNSAYSDAFSFTGSNGIESPRQGVSRASTNLMNVDVLKHNLPNLGVTPPTPTR